MTLSFNPGLAAAAFLFTGAAAGAAATSLTHTGLPSVDSSLVQKRLAERLPKTRITRVDCAKLAGLCEVTAGSNLFYVDYQARYLAIGRIYDMETRQDLTAARLLELSPDTLVAGAAHAERDGAGEGGAAPQPMRRVDLSSLPAKGAIRWGPANGPKLLVFSDFHCGYCRRLTGELLASGFRVEERPISVLGTRELSEAVYCAKDPVAALHGAYRDEVPTGSPKCDTSGLDANEAFARRNGFNGTPVIVRASDGMVVEGYRPASQLAAWAKQPVRG